MLKGCHLGDVRFTDPETVPALAYLLNASRVHPGLRSTGLHSPGGQGGGETGAAGLRINVSVDGPASQLVAHRTNQRGGSLWLPRGMGPLAH